MIMDATEWSKIDWKFSPQDRIDAHQELADDFIQRVLNVAGAWLSDESLLSDFARGDEGVEKFYARILTAYGVDVRPAVKIADILDYIAAENNN